MPDAFLAGALLLAGAFLTARAAAPWPVFTVRRDCWSMVFTMSLTIFRCPFMTRSAKSNTSSTTRSISCENGGTTRSVSLVMPAAGVSRNTPDAAGGPGLQLRQC